MPTPLANGYNVIINQKVGSTNTPIYPFTKTDNVKDATGNTLTSIISTLSQAATTGQVGRVQLSNAINSDSQTLAATPYAVKAALADVKNNYVALSQLGSASTTGEGAVTGVATLGTDGKVLTSQLPSYVDDVVDVEITFSGSTITKVEDGAGNEITTTAGEGNVAPESGKIYVDALGSTPTNKTYRWSGTAFVEISQSLALGETNSTAFDGLRGKAAYDHSLETHARVDATVVTDDAENGCIRVYGRTDKDSYAACESTDTGALAVVADDTDPFDSGTQIKISDVSGDVPAAVAGTTYVKLVKGGTKVTVYTLDSSAVVTALGYTPQNAATVATSSNSGVMSATQAAKLDNCMQTAVSETASAPAFTDGLWFEIISTDTTPGGGE